MKRFDLTFNGEVLPDYDPKQVKTGFAELFRIKDPNILDELFSGGMVVLRSNLDRKSAAEYFRKVTQLGGKAELVTTRATAETEASGDSQVETLPQAQQAGDMASVTRAPTPTPNDTSGKTELPSLAAQRAQKKSSAGPSAIEVLNRLADLKRDAEREYEEELDLINSQQSAEEIKTERELERTKAQQTQALDIADAEIRRLEALQESSQQQFQEHKEIILEEKEDRNRKLKRGLSKLEESKSHNIARSKQVESELETSVQATRKKSQQAIGKLEQLIKETRTQAELDIAELTQLQQENASRHDRDIKAVERESQSLAEAAEQGLLSLELRLEEHVQQKESELEDLRYLVNQAQLAKDEAVAGISRQEQAIYEQEKRHLEEFKRARERQAANLQKKLDRLKTEELKLTRGNTPST